MSKCEVIPLTHPDPVKFKEEVLASLCHEATAMNVVTTGKYLGFQVGPGKADKSWISPLAKFEKRTMAWADLKLGVHLNMRAFRTFIASVLGYIIQLERPSDAVCKGWNWSLRRLVPGPGNWITESDLTALSFLHISPCEFPTLESWSLASRVRVLFSLGMNGTIEKLVALEKWPSGTSRTPGPNAGSTFPRPVFY